MNRLRKVVSNTVISLVGQAVTWTSTLLLTIAYGQFLGDVKFGELYFATAFVLLIGFPLELGFNQQLTRDVAQEPDKASRYLSNTLLLKGALWLILYGLVLLICWLLNYNAEERVLVAICGFTLLSSSITNTFRALYIAVEQLVFPVVGNILEKGLAALIGILLLEHGASVQVMAFVLLGGSLVSTLWQALWFFRLTEGSLAFDWALMRNLIRTGIPFMLYGALTVVYYQIDTILLSLMTNAAIVGWYGAGYRLIDTLTFLANLVINAVMYPVFSKLSVTSEAKLKLAIEKSMNFLLFFGLPMSMGLIVTAPDIIQFLYHRAEFAHTVPALQGLAPGLVFLYANTVFSNVIISTKREKKITLMAAIALVFNLGLNIFLIPLYQHIGAAIVTSLTELLLLCLSIIFIPKHLLPIRSLTVAAKATIASFVMVLAILLLSAFHVANIFVVLPIAMLTYFATATLLGTIPREDIRLLYSALRHKVHPSSTQPLVSQQESSTINIARSFPEVDTPLPSIPHSEIELASEDKLELSDTGAQTEPQLEAPRWLHPAAVSSNEKSNGLRTALGGTLSRDKGRLSRLRVPLQAQNCTKGDIHMNVKSVFIVWYGYSRRAETLATELGGQVNFLYETRLKGRWLTPLRYLVQGWKTWRLLEQERPEVVLVQAPPIFAPLIVAIWCELRGKTGLPGHRIPYAIDCHTGTFYGRRWRWALLLLRLLSRRAAVTLVASEAALSILQDWKVRGIFLVDGLPALSPATGTVGSEGEARVAVIGSFAADEPVPEIFAAARLLPRVTFYFSGDPKRVASKLLTQKPENVILTGFLPDDVYTGLLHNVHGLVILTNERHVLNCGAYEALAVEKPAIISDWPGLRRCFTRGFIYVTTAPEAIAAGIEKMLTEQTMLKNEIIAMRSELAMRRQPHFEQFVALLTEGERISDEASSLVKEISL